MAVGLFSGIARGQAVVWADQFPHTTHVSGAADTALGVAISDSYTFVGGSRDVGSGVKKYTVTMYYLNDQSPSSQVADELEWPDSDGVTAVPTAMESFTYGDYAEVILTGYTFVDGYKRPTTIAVDNTGISGTLKLLWTATDEPTDSAVDVVPVAVSKTVEGEAPSYAIGRVGVLSTINNDVYVRVYNAATGSAAMPGKFWSDLENRAATPVGIGFVNTTYGPGVVVGVTTTDPTYTSTTSVALFGYQVNTSGGFSSGSLLGAGAIRISKPSTASDIGKAMTSDETGGYAGFVAVTGARTDGSAQDWVTAVVDPQGRTSATDELVFRWTDTLDNNDQIDVPSAITIYGVSPGNQVTGTMRVGVAGTTKATSGGATTDVLVAGYHADTHSPQLEWSKQQDNTATGYSSNDQPLVVAVGYYNNSPDVRMAVTGWTQQSSSGNYDLLGASFDARSQAIVGTSNRSRWINGYHRSGDDNADEGFGVAGGIMTDGTNSYDTLYFTGKTYDSTYADDWWTLRVVP